MVRFGSPDLRSSALGVKRVRGSVSPWSRDRPKPKKDPKLPKFKNLHPITNGSNMGPITTDFDETRWDLIPPMRPRSSGGSRVKEPSLEFFPRGDLFSGDLFLRVGVYVLTAFRKGRNPPFSERAGARRRSGGRAKRPEEYGPVWAVRGPGRAARGVWAGPGGPGAKPGGPGTMGRSGSPRLRVGPTWTPEKIYVSIGFGAFPTDLAYIKTPAGGHPAAQLGCF